MIVMKKILNSIIATIFAITLSGCWGLDYYPSNAIGEDNFLDRASDVDKLMNSTYAQIKNAWAFGYDFLFDSVTDIATGDYFQNCWQQTYNVVQRANTTIRLLSEAQTGTGAGEITTAMVNQGIAEAKFLRALGYFRLISLYGDIPYYDETTVLSESFGDMYVDISPIASVREKIINDLNEAEKVLPSSWETTKYGRATKWAAIALRGKVRLYAKEYAAAAADFDNVINNGIAYGSTKLALDPDYAHVFKTWGTGNRCPEMIFSIQNSNESGSATTSLMGNKSSLRQIPTDRMNPSPKLIDMYEKKDGTLNSQWASKPATMIRKVAVVQALRDAFPDDFGAMYSPEEMGEVNEVIPENDNPVVIPQEAIAAQPAPEPKAEPQAEEPKAEATNAEAALFGTN